MSQSLPPALGNVGALLLGPSFLTADLLGPLLDEDEEFLGGTSSPLSVSSGDSSDTLLPLPPPLSPPAGRACKLGEDQLTLPWLCDGPVGPASDEDAGLSGMDWLAEDLDLAEFDLDSLIGSYESEEPPSSPEELIASLESQWGAGLNQSSLQCAAPESPVSSLPEEAAVPPPSPLSQEPWQVLEIKSEPASPARVPSPVPSLLPSCALELGSEVDVAEGDHATPGIVLSLAGTHILVLLTPKEEPATASLGDQDDSDSGIGSDSGSPPHGGSCPSPPPSSPTPPPRAASRPKPYSVASRSDPAPTKPGKVKSATPATPVMVEKKLKKMEQNKTAATRYRQKKRVEQETLSQECSRLEERNRELSERADSLSREIQYLQGLIEEVRSAKSRRKGHQDSP